MQDKKKKPKYEDDGHTIYDMNGDAYWRKKDKVTEQPNIYVTKKEKKTIVKAAYSSYFPKLLLVLLCFGLAMLLIYFWLK